VAERKPGKKIEVEGDDVEELRQVFGAITEFMYNVKDLVKEFLETLSKSFDGEKIGKEVAQMYKSLVDAGMPPDKAYELTQRFLESKLEAIPKISSLLEVLEKQMKGGTGAIPIVVTKGKAGEKPGKVLIEKKDDKVEVRIEEREAEKDEETRQ
jgi:hypothetical protein